MNDFRQVLYDVYVAAHQRGQPNCSPEDYTAAALFLRRRYQRWLPEDKGAAVLDLGCGSGKALYWLQREGYANLCGIDISPEQVELARRIHPAVEQRDFISFLEGCENRFDVILALDVIEHFRREEALRLARSAHRALRGGGRLLIQTINARSPFAGYLRYDDLTHELSYTPHSLETLLGLAGFTKVDLAPLGPVVHGPVSALRWLLWQVIALGLIGYHLVERGTPDGAIFTQCFAACAHK